MNSGDTAWVLASTALVLLMTLPGLALFYGGLGPFQVGLVGDDAVLRHRRRGHPVVADHRL